MSTNPMEFEDDISDAKKLIATTPIPDKFQPCLLFSDNVHVAKILDIPVLLQSSNTATSQVTQYLNDALPFTADDILKLYDDLPIPTVLLLQKITKYAVVKIKNGRKAVMVVPPMTPITFLTLPIWIITWWIQVAELLTRAKALWSTTKEELSEMKNQGIKGLFSSALESLDYLSWRVYIPLSLDVAPVDSLAYFLLP
jgi:hypothetical protein